MVETVDEMHAFETSSHARTTVVHRAPLVIFGRGTVHHDSQHFLQANPTQTVH